MAASLRSYDQSLDLVSEDPMQVVTATEFKAKCLDFLDRVGEPDMERLSITKHGKVVAVLMPPPPEQGAVEALHGFLRGSVIIPDGFDLTMPILDQSFSAADGDLHL